MDSTFVVAISFVIFMGVAYRLGYRQLMAALDQKISDSRQELDKAAKAKEEAVRALENERQQDKAILEVSEKA